VRNDVKLIRRARLRVSDRQIECVTIAFIALDTSQGRPISRKNFSHHRNATMPIGLNDHGIAEIDLDAERRLDARKVRDQHRVGAASGTVAIISFIV
jgi:hypothetical protein